MIIFRFLVYILLSVTVLNANENVLVTGGNGYIGLSTCRILKEKGYTPVSVDNSSNSKIPTVSWGPTENGDILDKKWLRSIFKKYKFVGIIHLAAKIYVPESTEKPLLYYKENVAGSLNVLELAKEFQIKGLVFSSTCAVYGILESDTPVLESQILSPLSPYAESKLVIERLIGFLWESDHIPSAILRYFNVSGVDSLTDNKDGHSAQLIPCLVKAFQQTPAEVQIFGTDYSTEDGTCIRDYVHVVDVAKANVKALEYILAEKKPIITNIGTGKGYTVKQIAESVSKYAKKEYKENCLPRRKGDVPIVVADIGCAKQNFDWQPENSSLESIVGSYYGVS